MLTVIREMARGADAARDGGAERALEAALAEGERALARTPELLPRLREAGVVDAGGAGLVELLRGLLAGVRGEPAPPPLATAELGHRRRARCHARRAVGLPLLHELPRRGRGGRQGRARPPRSRRSATACSSWALAPAFKAHVHTDDPGGALRVGTAAGVIGGVEVSDMHAQTAERLAAARPRARLRRRVHLARRRQPGARRVARRPRGRRSRSRGRRSVDRARSSLRSTARVRTSVLVLPNDASALLAAESAAAHAREARARAAEPLARRGSVRARRLPARRRPRGERLAR